MLASGYVFTIRFVRRIESTAARARAELDLAKQIHESVVPPVSLRTSCVEVFGRSDPSSEMGGDLIDAIERRAGVDIYLADVSGHGVGAGIVMGMVKSAIRMCLRNEPPLESLVTDLNAVLTDLTRPNMFATFACLRIPVDGPIQYALAGHLPILHAIASSGEVREIPNQHLPLGITFDEDYLSGTLTASPGDTLAILTDGLTEVQNADGKELGFAAIREAFRANSSRSLPELHDAVVAAARSHGPQLDDQSLILVRVLRPEPRP
jgi:serine phosphatase RsbU (regulator of sigma subunit)